MEKLAETINEFIFQVYKTASYPTLENSKPLVKNTIKSLKKDPLMEGVYYASNIELQQLPEYFKINFILNVSNDPKIYQKLQANRAQRVQLIVGTLMNVFTRYFPEVTFKFGFQDLPIDKPGWTDKEAD